jgi:hypothetical protein
MRTRKPVAALSLVDGALWDAAFTRGDAGDRVEVSPDFFVAPLATFPVALRATVLVTFAAAVLLVER